jgi:hypothetical protein
MQLAFLRRDALPVIDARSKARRDVNAVTMMVMMVPTMVMMVVTAMTAAVIIIVLCFCCTRLRFRRNLGSRSGRNRSNNTGDRKRTCSNRTIKSSLEHDYFSLLWT